MILRCYNNLSINQLQKSIVLLSIIITCWVMYIQQGWINDDSLVYFEAARLFSEGEWKAGMDAFPWPFYPLLIAGLHYLTTFSFQLCAQILTVIFFAITTHSLLRIIILAGGNKLNLVSLSFLLFSTTYIVGSVLPMLLRDQGFWAFLLSALVFFIKYYRHHNIQDALYWQLCALIAFLFRIEAAIYIVFLPLTLFHSSKFHSSNLKISNKIRLIAEAQILNILIIILSIFAILLHGSLTLNDLGRVQDFFDVLSQFQKNFNLIISTKVHAMASSVLGEQLEDFAWISFIFSLTFIALIKCLLITGWLPPILTSIFYKKIKCNMAEDVFHIISIAALFAFINAVLIIFKVNILVGRYVILFGFMLLIFATFALQALAEECSLEQASLVKKTMLVITLTGLSIGVISNSLPKTANYTYEQDAVAYIKTQPKSSNDQVFYASYKARHYAGEAYIGRWNNLWAYTQQAITNKSIYQYNYLAINFTSDDNPAEIEKNLKEKLPQYVLLKKFYGYRNKKGILVYKKDKAN